MENGNLGSGLCSYLHRTWQLLQVDRNSLFFHHPSISILRLRCCPCPIIWGWQHQAMSNTGSPCKSVLWMNASQATLIDVSLYIFRPCLPRPSLLSSAGNWKVWGRFDTGRDCSWTYYLSRQKRRTDVVSSMPSFCSNEATGVPSLSLMPQIQRIMAWSLRWSRWRSRLFGPHVSLPWSRAMQTQASYTLPCTLGDWCVVVKDRQEFP